MDMQERQREETVGKHQYGTNTNTVQTFVGVFVSCASVVEIRRHCLDSMMSQFVSHNNPVFVILERNIDDQIEYVHPTICIYIYVHGDTPCSGTRNMLHALRLDVFKRAGRAYRGRMGRAFEARGGA